LMMVYLPQEEVDAAADGDKKVMILLAFFD
jgi:hypothetical protein